QELYRKIIQCQIETGVPYVLYKDACNEKSNQKNLGTIKSSNLCAEIVQFTSRDEVAVCNLASIALPNFLVESDDGLSFDHDKLIEVTRTITRNLDRVIDVNYYPIEEAKTSNLRHRPIAVGVQGLADLFMRLNVAFDSPEARALNRDVF